MTQFTAIVPPDMAAAWLALGESLLMDAVDQATSTMIKPDFDSTTATWKSAPDFNVDRAAYQGSDIVGSVWTDNEVYGYVNNGTIPHDIFPVKAKKLHFMSGYTAKTVKRVVGSQSGGAFGNDVFSAGVHHPGSEGREFDQAIVDKRQAGFEALIVSLINQAAAKVS